MRLSARYLLLGAALASAAAYALPLPPEPVLFTFGIGAVGFMLGYSYRALRRWQARHGWSAVTGNPHSLAVAEERALAVTRRHRLRMFLRSFAARAVQPLEAYRPRQVARVA